MDLIRDVNRAIPVLGYIDFALHARLELKGGSPEMRVPKDLFCLHW